MKWILILVYVSFKTGAAVHTQEFNTEKACLDAMKVARQISDVGAACVQKGEEP